MSDLIHKGDVPPMQIIPPSESAAMMLVIQRAATDPNCDVEKMERLYAMHERMLDRQAAQEFAEAMALCQAEAKKAAKDRTNTQTKSDYATLEAIDEAIRPVYTRHGFSLSFDTDESPLANHVRILCDVMHKGGHTKRYKYDNPMDDKGIQGSVNKTPTHARGSAVTYGRRYATMLIFNIQTGYHDDDGNGAHGDSETDAAHLGWLDAMNNAGTLDELRKVKAEMVGKLGEAIPANLVAHYNARFATLKGAA